MMDKESTFRQEGFLSKEHNQNNKIQDENAHAFEFLRDINTMMMEMSTKFPNTAIAKNIVAHALMFRVIQSLQAVISLLNVGYRAEIFSIIRMMQESYLFLALHVKNEKKLHEILHGDEYGFKLKMHTAISNAPEYSDYHEMTKESEVRLREQMNDEKTYFGYESKSKTASITAVYNETSTEQNSISIYRDYLLISNTYCHVSINSLCQHVQKTQEGTTLLFRPANKGEIWEAVMYASKACTAFSGIINKSYLNGLYSEELKQLYRYMESILRDNGGIK
ncbi:DUF5677 domain-containing protein [Acetobacter thailandicus]|uniref:DUF5677 domain-containing protein n=1 Tax=Acetobacter thailandicus TaxID=1502842 RepID=UPI001BA7AEA5|nr:DUF5677 domain-containing protein [Acetobacter thailandicus]MBS0961382.1 hypothetical protein [Acetobacter thailandicus]